MLVLNVIAAAVLASAAPSSPDQAILMLTIAAALFTIGLLSFFFRGRQRVSGADPQTQLPCEWCHKILPTTTEEIWSNAFPAGRLVRLCASCASKCA
jgi:hypothetical protein